MWHHMTHPWHPVTSMTHPRHPVTSHDSSMTSMTSHDPSMTSCDITWANANEMRLHWVQQKMTASLNPRLFPSFWELGGEAEECFSWAILTLHHCKGSARHLGIPVRDNRAIHTYTSESMSCRVYEPGAEWYSRRSSPLCCWLPGTAAPLHQDHSAGKNHLTWTQ